MSLLPQAEFKAACCLEPRIADAVRGVYAALNRLPGLGLHLVDVKDSRGLTPLHMAAANSAPGVAACIVPLLLDQGADVHAEHDTLLRGRVQPLHCAAANECPQAGAGAAEQLLAAGADVNAVSSGSWRPLHFAARARSLSAAQVLLAAGGIDVNARDSKGRTALHRAASGRGDPLTGMQLVGALVAAGADLGAADQGGRTPVDCARATELYSTAARALLQLHHAAESAVAAAVAPPGAAGASSPQAPTVAAPADAQPAKRQRVSCQSCMSRSLCLLASQLSCSELLPWCLSCMPDCRTHPTAASAG